jgi:hypothetical protein
VRIDSINITDDEFLSKLNSYGQKNSNFDYNYVISNILSLKIRNVLY